MHLFFELIVHPHRVDFQAFQVDKNQCLCQRERGNTHQTACLPFITFHTEYSSIISTEKYTLKKGGWRGEGRALTKNYLALEFFVIPTKENVRARINDKRITFERCDLRDSVSEKTLQETEVEEMAHLTIFERIGR